MHNVCSEKFTSTSTRSVLALSFLSPLLYTVSQGAVALHTDWESQPARTDSPTAADRPSQGMTAGAHQ